MTGDSRPLYRPVPAIEDVQVELVVVDDLGGAVRVEVEGGARVHPAVVDRRVAPQDGQLGPGPDSSAPAVVSLVGRHFGPLLAQFAPPSLYQSADRFDIVQPANFDRTVDTSPVDLTPTAPSTYYQVDDDNGTPYDIRLIKNGPGIHLHF